MISYYINTFKHFISIYIQVVYIQCPTQTQTHHHHKIKRKRKYRKDLLIMATGHNGHSIHYRVSRTQPRISYLSQTQNAKMQMIQRSIQAACPLYPLPRTQCPNVIMPRIRWGQDFFIRGHQSCVTNVVGMGVRVDLFESLRTCAHTAGPLIAHCSLTTSRMLQRHSTSPPRSISR